MKSIMHQKDGTCFLCALLHGDYSQKLTQEHHAIFGTAGRKLSERYGLKVYLCIPHHTAGPEAVHKNAKIAQLVKAAAQRAFCKVFPELEWMTIFGKNYDTEPEEKPVERQQDSSPGFILLEPGKGVDDDGIW